MITGFIGKMGCHRAGTKILSKKGVINIEEVSDQDLVWNGCKWSKCYPIHQGVKETIKIVLQDKTLFEMTPDHMMFTTAGCVPARELTTSHKFIKSTEDVIGTGIKSISKGATQEVFDLHVFEDNRYIANGYLSHNSGKTLSMVREACKYYAQGFTIYSNFGLKIPYEKLDFDTLFHMAENQEDMKNVVILLDEVHILLDSRSGMKKSSKVVSFWLNQTRKMGVKLFYTTQHIHQIDKRLRSGTDFFCFCEGIKYLRKGKEFFIVVNTVSNGDTAKEEVFLGNKFFKYYDTNEVISFMKSEEVTSGHGEKTSDDDGSFIPEFADNRKELKQ